ncbi:MAG: SGNH/GDSL hydrolase family protein [Prolixibacteraceae bacterium]|nr:SGNH/GDSL hydrolase family protein [Prolixibacteraceae bacterium]
MNDKKWVGTWSCAPYAASNNTPPSPYLANNTLRQIVRVSIGGDTLRVKFSNITCPTPVTMNSVNIALSKESGGSAIDATTLKYLKFNGDESVTMDAHSEVISDPLAFPLTPGMYLAITIYYGECETSADMTFHYGSRTDSYILTGNQSESETFSGATAVERWYNLNTIEVLTTVSSSAVAVLGNSITDGYGLHGGPKNKWTDFFSQRLLENPATSNVGVLNLGIGATLLTTSGVSRFQQDILNQNGLRWIIVFYGVNDINAGVSASKIISACKGLIDQAHAANVLIYGATITPFKGHYYFSTSHEAVRQEVNEWIRTPGNFDKCIDFDKIIRDPSDSLKLPEAYSNDWLHPNADGYKLLGESVDLNLFLDGDKK